MLARRGCERARQTDDHFLGDGLDRSRDIHVEVGQQVLVRPAQESAIKAAAIARGAAFTVLGEVGGDALELEGLGKASVVELSSAYRTAFPSLVAGK